MIATSVPKLGKPSAQLLVSGHHPVPPVYSSLLVLNAVPAAVFSSLPSEDKFSLMLSPTLSFPSLLCHPGPLP